MALDGTGQVIDLPAGVAERDESPDPCLTLNLPIAFYAVSK